MGSLESCDLPHCSVPLKENKSSYEKYTTTLLLCCGVALWTAGGSRVQFVLILSSVWVSIASSFCSWLKSKNEQSSTTYEHSELQPTTHHLTSIILFTSPNTCPLTEDSRSNISDSKKKKKWGWRELMWRMKHTEEARDKYRRRRLHKSV